MLKVNRELPHETLIYPIVHVENKFYEHFSRKFWKYKKLKNSEDEFIEYLASIPYVWEIKYYNINYPFVMLHPFGFDTAICVTTYDIATGQFDYLYFKTYSNFLGAFIIRYEWSNKKLPRKERKLCWKTLGF